MDNNIKEQLLQDILNLQEDINDGFSLWENSQENLQVLSNKFSELLIKSEELKKEDPASYATLEETVFDNKGILSVLNILNDDLKEGLLNVIGKVTEDKDETVKNMREYSESNEYHSWLGKNLRTKVEKRVKSIDERNKINGVIEEFLPSVKAEQVGDLYALAYAGVLSEKQPEFSSIENEGERITFVKKLIHEKKLALKVDFSTLTITDETVAKRITSPDGQFSGQRNAAQSIIDSAVLSTDKKTLVCVCSTANKDTSTQNDQVYKIYHTLQKARENGVLKIDGADNPEIKIIINNRAFFCTQSKDKAKTFISSGPNGGIQEVEGFHHASNRNEFEKLIAPGQEVSKEEMDKLNSLVTLSMIGNKLDYPRYPYTFEISDIANVYPVTSGANTDWLINKFEEIKGFYGEQREQKFFEFMIDYSIDVIDTLNKLKKEPNDTNSVQNSLVKSIALSYQRTLEGLADNFSSYNLGEEYINLFDFEDKVEAIRAKTKIFNTGSNVKISTSALAVLRDKQELIEKGLDAEGILQNPNLTNIDVKLVEAYVPVVIKDVLSENQAYDKKKGFINKFVRGVSEFEQKSEVSILHEKLDNLLVPLFYKNNVSSESAPSGYLTVALYALKGEEKSLDKIKKFNKNETVKKNFKELQDSLEKTQPGASLKLENARNEFLRFMNELTYYEGASKIGNAKGYKERLETVVSNIENNLEDLTIKRENTKTVKLK